MRPVVVLQGQLGWGNRKGGLEAYGPGGRWGASRNGQQQQGDLLGDALEDAGATEGAALIVVAAPRPHSFGVEAMAELAAAVQAAVDAWAQARA